MMNPTFCEIIPSSLFKVNQYFRRTCHSSTLKLEATFSSETSTDFQCTTQHYNLEDITPYPPLQEPEILQITDL
jgi:hypothetical protein